MIPPFLERIYLLLFVLVYYFFRLKPIGGDEIRKYNKFHLPIEIFILFSIFGNFFSITIGGFNIRLAYILFLVYFFVFSFNYRIKLKLSITQLYLMLFFTCILLSTFWMTINIGVHVRIVVTLMAIGLLFAFNYYLSAYRNYSLLLNNLWRIGIISASIGIIEVVGYYSFGVKIPYPIISRTFDTSPTLLIRAFGAMDEPNWFGINLMVFFLIFLNSDYSSKKGYWFIFLFAFMLAGNKVVMLIVALVSVLFFWQIGQLKVNLRNLFLLLLVIPIGVLLLNTSIVNDVLLGRFKKSFSYLSSSSSEEVFAEYDRFVYIYYLFKGFLSNPILGNGLNSGIYVQHLIPWYQKPISELTPMQGIGSSLFRILYEQGILGFMLLMGFLKRIYLLRIYSFLGKMFVISLIGTFLFYDFFPAIYGVPIFLLITVLLSKSS